MKVLLKRLSLPVFMALLLAATGVWIAGMINAGPNTPDTTAQVAQTDANDADLEKSIIKAEGLEPVRTKKSVLSLPPVYIEQEAEVKYGQTLAQVLNKAGFSGRDIHNATRALDKKYKLSRMPAGADFIFTYLEPATGQPPLLQSLSLYTKTDKFIRVSRNADGGYTAEVDNRHVLRVPQVAIGKIDSSLYLAAQNAGLPDRLIVPFIELFSWDLDFTRDIRKGDTFRIVYEEVQDERGEFIRYGNILAGEMTLKRKDAPVSAFRTPNGDYYNKDGNAKKRALLRTPIKFSRISSHFNPHRKHPVLGYTRAHKGTDFAAPTGTPVKAAGDGRVEEVKWRGGYGRYVRIRHNSTFSTAYAHLSRYKRGMRPGKYVRQGDTIGYVGMSGTATGPHLHYEVLRHGRQVNAMRVKLPEGAPLAKDMRTTFRQHVAMTEKLWLQASRVAKAEKPDKQ